MTPDGMERMAARYGDIFRVRLLMPRHPGDVTRWEIGSTDVVILHSPQLLKELFAAGPELSGGEGRRFTVTVFGERSLLILDGERHHDERRRLLSLFAPEHLESYLRTMEDAAARFVADLPASGQADLAPLVNRLVVAASLRFVFGPTNSTALTALTDLMEQVGGLPDWSPPMLFFPALRRPRGRLSPGARTARFLASVRAALDELATDPVAAGPGTLYGRLLALEHSGPAEDAPDWRLARVMGVMAGFDTTAVAAQWALLHLLADPDALARSRADPAYLDAACREAARVHAAVPILVRRVVAPCRFAGYELRPGGFVVACVYITHRRADLYPDPLRFRPERFLERSFGPHEFVPFGGGSRRCIGQALAFRQMSVALGALLRRFDLAPLRPPRNGIGRRAVVMTPKDPLPARFRDRT
jgi:cytochrome P450